MGGTATSRACDLRLARLLLRAHLLELSRVTVSERLVPHGSTHVPCPVGRRGGRDSSTDRYSHELGAASHELGTDGLVVASALLCGRWGPVASSRGDLSFSTGVPDPRLRLKRQGTYRWDEGPMGASVPCEPARVFLLIENRLLREALVRLLRERPDFRAVGQSGQTDLTIQKILQAKCDVLVVCSFQSNWPAATFALESTGQPGFRIVLIGMEADENQFMAMIRAGVTGYLLKDASAPDFLYAVRAVFRGEAVCPPQLCSALCRFVAQMPKEACTQGIPSRPDLTLRQHQLVTLVAKGLTNKEIASRLNLSEFTVRNHIHRILKQLDPETRREAVDVVRASGYMISA
jgi:two-component system nitrate/nitrite response regulator NarL